MVFSLFLTGCSPEGKVNDDQRSISGIYPHLAFYNQGRECGVGAVVFWADRMWVITYAPHFPFGSDDKLYEIKPGLQRILRPESIGGTPANRMIHKESNQLFIGPYAIDANRNVRVIPYDEMPGRHTGNARHLFEPESKIYYATMEEGFYEVDVNTMEVKQIYEDGNVTARRKKDQKGDIPVADLSGAHGKGLYSGQGVLVYSNNGEPGAGGQLDIESGALSEWDGKDWKTIRRAQFVEVTGPGCIRGNKNAESDPIWATGWDNKSVLVGVRDAREWSFYRLPKASHTYDASHGHYSEWPRIRNIGTIEHPDYLMTMHGMFWQFPQSFTSAKSSGIRPRSAYLKVISDYTRYDDQLVFGCNDAAQNQYDVSKRIPENVPDPGQSNSNLWFTPLNQPDVLGPTTAFGAVWLNEEVKAGEHSEPYLFAGWQKRGVWIQNQGKVATDFSFEVDKEGSGSWVSIDNLTIEPGKDIFMSFNPGVSGEWIRVIASADTKATIYFVYTGEDNRGNGSNDIFTGLSDVSDNNVTAGLLYGLGNEKQALGLAVRHYNRDKISEVGYYELDERMNLKAKDDPETYAFITENLDIPTDVVTIDSSSVLVIDQSDRRWRLPLGHKDFTRLTNSGALNISRDVVTQRHLVNCHGTFYELPEKDADGFAKIRPVASHNYRINDFASYRGLLIMTGIDPRSSKGNSHIIISDDNKAAVWAGTIDDLWKMGKPVGHGGPWKESIISADMPSDPYLFGFYDQRKLILSHDSHEKIQFTIQFDPDGSGDWMTWKEVSVPSNETFEHNFPQEFQARWIRFLVNRNCKATAWLEYK